MSRKPFVLVALLVAIALLLAACGGAAEQAQQAVEVSYQGLCESGCGGST